MDAWMQRMWLIQVWTTCQVWTTPSEISVHETMVGDEHGSLFHVATSDWWLKVTVSSQYQEVKFWDMTHLPWNILGPESTARTWCWTCFDVKSFAWMKWMRAQTTPWPFVLRQTTVLCGALVRAESHCEWIWGHLDRSSEVMWDGDHKNRERWGLLMLFPSGAGERESTPVV